MDQPGKTQVGVAAEIGELAGQNPAFARELAKKTEHGGGAGTGMGIRGQSRRGRADRTR